MPTGKKFQACWALLHFYASVLALLAASMHVSSTLYHLERFRNQ